jgi:hypothetical protein
MFMFNKQKYLDKLDELIALGRNVVAGWHQEGQIYGIEGSSEFRSSAETFIVSLYGKDSPNHKHFLHVMSTTYPNDYVEAVGILSGIKKHIGQGWMDNVKNQLSAEIFNDYLDMAKYLNQEGYYLAAAVIAGTTLEERVRQLCLLHGLSLEIADARTGEMKPIKADQLNISLAPHYADSRNDSRSFLKNYGLRNEPTHGNWNSDPPEKKTHRVEQVNLMVQEVEFFIRTNPI